MIKKDIKYYMGLNYPIEILKIPADEGGGYYACIPQLGRDVFLGDGETVEEAMNNLQRVKKEWFEIYIEKGLPITEPESEDDLKYSGKLIIRIPTELHKHLSENAGKNNTSLNQYISFLLSKNSYQSEYIRERANIHRKKKVV